MKNILSFIKHRKIILALLHYSFDQVICYDHLTKKEKEIITSKQMFLEIKKLYDKQL